MSCTMRSCITHCHSVAATSLLHAGGGASVIYADTVGDLGYAHELGNYAEYSGAPNTAETYAYAKTLLDCATANPDGRPRALLVGGGIANFTDVAATFRGIIQVRLQAWRAVNTAGTLLGGMTALCNCQAAFGGAI